MDFSPKKALDILRRTIWRNFWEQDSLEKKPAAMKGKGSFGSTSFDRIMS